MVTLLLLRHAKAVQHGPDGDFARTLTQKGEADATALGHYLARAGIIPDFADVSAAARTMQTFERLAMSFAPRDVPFAEESSLYNATAGDIRDRVRTAPPEARTLMIVGHNPGIMEAAVMLIGDGDPVEIERLRKRFPPGALALISFAADTWPDARASGGRLDLFLTPEDVNEAR